MAAKHGLDDSSARGMQLLSLVFDVSDPAAVNVKASSHFSCYSIFDGSGARVGTLWGVLIHDWLHPNVSIEGDEIHWSGTVDKLADFEREVVDGLNGAFVLVTSGPSPARLYLDSGGQIPIVFDGETRRAGLSANDILNGEEYQERLLPGRIERLIAREGRGSWISGTLTAHRGIERLLPNHYLDLSSFKSHRYWPAADVRHDLSFDEGVDQVSSALRGYVEAVARQFDAAITLTAGFDSRLLLTAARGVADQIKFVTTTPRDPGIDQIVSQTLARRLGVRHELLPVVEADVDGQMLWDRAVGHAIQEVNRKSFPTLRNIHAELMLTGMYGETGRCRLYRQDLEQIDQEPATTRFVLARLTLPLDPELVENIDTWIDPIRHLPRSMVLDLAFNELKFGSWAMGQAPIQKAMKMSLAPYGQRAVLDAFMRVPPAMRGTSALFNAVGKSLWPEAMELPINAYGDWRDVVAPIKKVFNIERIRRHLRDRFARS